MPTICSALMLVSSSEPAMNGHDSVPPARKKSCEESLVSRFSWRTRHQVAKATSAVRKRKTPNWMALEFIDVLHVTRRDCTRHSQIKRPLPAGAQARAQSPAEARYQNL